MTVYFGLFFSLQKLHFNHTLAVKPTTVNMRNCQVVLIVEIRITKTMNLLTMGGAQIRVCLFTFHPIALKQLNSLTTINTFS